MAHLEGKTPSQLSQGLFLTRWSDFTENIVPLCQDETVSLSDKLIEIKGSAEMVSVLE